MSGIPGLNKELFFDVEKVLIEFGFEVFNPGRNTAGSWLDLMLYDIKHLEECQMVMFFKGWEKSPGCQIEHIVATRLGLTVLFANNLGE